MMSRNRKKAPRKSLPEVGTVDAAILPSGASARGLIRRIDALGKAILTGSIRPDVAKLQIALNHQTIQVMAFAHKAVELAHKERELDLERAKHASREAGRLRSAEIQVGTADPLGYQAVVRRLNGATNGAKQ